MKCLRGRGCGCGWGECGRTAGRGLLLLRSALLSTRSALGSADPLMPPAARPPTPPPPYPPTERGHRIPEDVARLYFRDMCKVPLLYCCRCTATPGASCRRVACSTTRAEQRRCICCGHATRPGLTRSAPPASCPAPSSPLPPPHTHSVRAQALAYLHCRQRVVHGDLKPENALMGACGRVALSDFGCSKLLGGVTGGGDGEGGGEPEFDRCNGTPAFLAPEMMTPNARYRYCTASMLAGWPGLPLLHFLCASAPHGRHACAEAATLCPPTCRPPALAAGAAPPMCIPWAPASTLLCLARSPSGLLC